MESEPDRQRHLGEYRGDRDEDRFWSEVRPEKEPVAKRWFLPASLLLIALSVPWYFVESWTDRSLIGLPLWIWAALASSAGLSLLNAVAALLLWDDDGAESEDEAAARRHAEDSAFSTGG